MVCAVVAPSHAELEGALLSGRVIATRQPPRSIMHFARTRTRLTAWLGLVAMVLLFFAPMVSQAVSPHVLLTPFEQAAPLCEAKPSVGADMPAGHGMPADHHAACGYCDLLAQHGLAPPAILPMAVPAPVHVSAWTAAPMRLAAREIRHTARPRDSPFLI